jgi:phage terminase large subunit-like protein
VDTAGRAFDREAFDEAERGRRHAELLERHEPVGDIPRRRDEPVPASWLLALAPDEREELIAGLSEAEARALLFDWPAWARPEQLAPSHWTWGWLGLAGRGWGKTRVGAETVRAAVGAGEAERIAFVGRTVADVRMVMIEGESGLLACYPPEERPAYEPSKRTVQWLAPGQRFVAGAVYTGAARRAVGFTYSDDVPDQLRGPQHDLAWCDELAAWRNAWGPGGYTGGDLPAEGGTWSNLVLGLRLSELPRWIATTTPKPVKLVRYLLGPLAGGSVVRTRGSTYENIDNLPDSFVQEVLGRYAGTRLERQEILGELIEEIEGALWTWTMLDAARAAWAAILSATAREPATRRRVVGVDPPAESGAEGSCCGIVVAAALAVPERWAVIADRSVEHATPAQWGRAAVSAFHELQADRIVCEVNNGGEMVAHVIRSIDARVPVSVVRASVGKHLRAEPIAALYEQGKVMHAGGMPDLEEQMATWTPDTNESPDRLDAAVWALTELAHVRRGGKLRAW